jgi:LysR family glycine cleavage system transcriptional activator
VVSNDQSCHGYEHYSLCRSGGVRDAHIPTVGELHAFVACARTGSTTRAAEELNLTQSAISRSLGTLEERLGVLLFHRVKQRLVLSDAGKSFLREAERILQELNHAAVAVMAFGGHNEVLRLAVLPTFGSRWLVPRLKDFRRIMPSVTFDIVSRLDPVDFDAEPFDAAELLPLVEESLVVVAAPALVGQGRALDDDELARLPLLQQTTRPSLWLDWFRDAGSDLRSVVRGPRFEHFDMIISAAIAELGVALVPEVVVEPDIAAGRLVIASPRRMVVSAPYSLIYPERSLNLESFIAFRAWIAQAANAVVASPPLDS